MSKKEQIIELYLEGLNKNQISLKVGCAYSYVTSTINLYKLQMLVKEQE